MWAWLVSSYQLSFWGTVFAAIIAVLIVTPLTWWLSGQWLEWRRKNLFHTEFVDHWPPGEKPIDTMNPHHIPIGSSEHFLRVTTNDGITLPKFNIRFVDPADDFKGPEEPLTDLRHILSIKGVDITPEFRSEGIAATPINDQKGGFNIVLSPAITLAANEPMTIRLHVEASGIEWDGKISFRARDPEGQRRKNRCDVTTKKH